eukprot:TRINITY_DN737_c0_g1_i4.p1 TRINITY_DN737_c0_g1~~TRINITY_DN737_c0_g1_i4.p1  ORF type:complete len:536 (+),score=75.25 TRINITY_DN737_c0_g1_i4:501-2108(+)
MLGGMSSLPLLVFFYPTPPFQFSICFGSITFFEEWIFISELCDEREKKKKRKEKKKKKKKKKKMMDKRQQPVQKPGFGLPVVANNNNNNNTSAPSSPVRLGSSGANFQQQQQPHYLTAALLTSAPTLPAAGQQQQQQQHHQHQQCGCESVSRTSVQGVPKTAEVVHVFDPLNKRAYTLLYEPVAKHAEVIPTTGLATYFSVRESCTSKRFFLCKQYQNGKCRAYHNCNSIHACRGKIALLRQQHPPTKQAMEADVLLPIYTDEQDNTTFTVPMDRTERTAGRDLLMTNFRSGGVGKLCVAFEMRPSACVDLNCSSIHVDGNHMKHVRSMWRVPCCSDAACIGDSAAKQVIFPTIGSQSIQGFTFTDGLCRPGSGVKVYWPKEALGVTKGLKDLDYSSVEYREDGLYVRFQPGKLCRPHQRKACKWGADCNNLHVCRHKASSEHLGVPSWSASASSSEFSTPTTSPNASPRGLHGRNASTWSESTPSPSGSPRHTANQYPSSIVTPEANLAIAPLLNSFRTFHLPTGGMNEFGAKK